MRVAKGVGRREKGLKQFEIMHLLISTYLLIVEKIPLYVT